MPAAVMLPKATLFLDVLPKLHQGAAATSASSHDAVKITIAKLGVVGCVAQGEAGAITIMGIVVRECVSVAVLIGRGQLETASSREGQIIVCLQRNTHVVKQHPPHPMSPLVQLKPQTPSPCAKVCSLIV
jgi:hypothetical protein